MRIASSLIFALGAALTARADFSYTTTARNPVDAEAHQTSRPAEGAMGAAAGSQMTKHYLKGQKIRIDNGSTATILDFEAQTLTVISNNQKTYTITKFADLGQAVNRSDLEANVDLKETGQRRTINGYNANEAVLTMEFDSAQVSTAVKMQVEVEMWFSPDVPGSEEWRAFFQKNQDRFPWSAVSAGANPGMQQAMAGLQRKLATLHGVPVLQVIRVKPAGNDAQAAQAQQGMEKARAQLEAMAQQGGPQAAAAQQALARMGAMASGSGALFEITQESSGFSTSAIPDSVFAIPAGYQQK